MPPLLNGQIELYIQYSSQCIFYYNFYEPGAASVRDIQLIAGFLDASSLFFGELGFGANELFRIIRGNAELRMHTGDPIQATLLLRGLSNLDSEAYHELDELTKSIIIRFNTEYIKEIEEFITQGKFRFKGIDTYIRDEVEKMKLHMYTGYLMRILGLAMNRNVIAKLAENMLSSFNRLYETFTQDNQTMQEFNDQMRANIESLCTRVTLQRIVQKVNEEYAPVWNLFQVPIIPIELKK